RAPSPAHARLVSCSFPATPPPDNYTLSLHDALPIYLDPPRVRAAIERSFRAWMEIDCGGGLPAFNVRLNDATTRCQYAGFDFNGDRKSTRLNSSHVKISYAVFCLKKNESSLSFVRAS